MPHQSWVEIVDGPFKGEKIVPVLIYGGGCFRSSFLPGDGPAELHEFRLETALDVRPGRARWVRKVFEFEDGDGPASGFYPEEIQGIPADAAPVAWGAVNYSSVAGSGPRLNEAR